jgi:glucose-1-phosphate thymidylyltransferase
MSPSRKMKAVICAGGKGTRLYPLTKAINKHLLPIGKKPMILHIVESLKSSGVDDIAIVTTAEAMTQISSFLGSGKDFDCNLSYFCQDRSLGIPDAILCAQSFIGDDPFIVVLGDNIFEDSLKDPISRFLESKSDAMLFLSKVENPSQFGIAKIEDGKIVEIIEKPKDPPSNLCVTGIYLYSAHVLERMRRLGLSKRNEYEISDLNTELIKEGTVSFRELSGLWLDAGTLDDYVAAFVRASCQS